MSAKQTKGCPNSGEFAPAAILYQIFVISPSVIFQKKNDSFALLRYPILFMRLGAPHKIDHCANRCSLYPPQAAVASVARQREPVFVHKL